MGLISRLFTRRGQVSNHQRFLHLAGPGLFGVKISEGARYQSSLEALYGSWTSNRQNTIVDAYLIDEGDNPTDKNTVRVEIEGRTIGYLDGLDAVLHRKTLRTYGTPGMTAICAALIVCNGHRDVTCQTNFEVKLDLPMTTKKLTGALAGSVHMRQESIISGEVRIGNDSPFAIQGGTLDSQRCEIRLRGQEKIRIYAFQSNMIFPKSKRGEEEEYTFLGPLIGLYHNTVDPREGPFVNHYISSLRMQIKYSESYADFNLSGSADYANSYFDPYSAGEARRPPAHGIWDFELDFKFMFPELNFR